MKRNKFLFFVLIFYLFIFPGCNKQKIVKENVMVEISENASNSDEVYSHADYNIIFENSEVEGIPVEELNIGEVNLPSGKIIVCDPLVFPNPKPLTKTVQPGKYPLKIYVAETEYSGDRYAVARLEIDDRRADKWVLALRDGEDAGTLKEYEFFGFPVDAGLGGIFDYITGIEYSNFLNSHISEDPDWNSYDDFFAAEFKKSAKDQNNPQDIGDWVNYTFPGTDLNITMFHSGYGDGVYPAYWGMTESGEIVSLVIDFFVLLLPDEEE